MLYSITNIAALRERVGIARGMVRCQNAAGETSLERQIAATDAQIDQLVYDPYGLSAEEINVVEEASK